MPSSTTEIMGAIAADVRVARGRLTVELSDGRTITVPLAWFPRLLHGTAKERGVWRLIGGGHGIHWPQLDEDISVEGLLAGRPSQESETSLKRWLAARGKLAQRGKNGRSPRLVRQHQDK